MPVKDKFISVDLFDKNPEEIINWFKSKGFSISYNWQDVWQEAHAKSFTVAKAMTLDILKDCKDITVKAFEEGLTREEFVKQLEPRLRSKGWWGKQDVVNPKTGETENVQLGSPYRLKTIYDVNTQTAFMSGRYKSQMENVGDRPYWQYLSVRDNRVRPAHRELNEKIFRYDDPFWDKAYPPNGWRCRCRVRALSDENLKDEKLKVGKGADYLSKIKIDEGWDYNPGKSALWDKTENIKVIDKLTYKDFDRPSVNDLPETNFQDAPKLLRRGSSETEALDIMCKALGIENKEGSVRYIKTPAGEVLVKPELLKHIIKKRSDARERYSDFLIKTLEKPFEIYITEFENGPREQFIGLFKGSTNILSTVRINAEGNIIWNMIPIKKSRMDSYRRGTLIYPRDKKSGR